MKNKQLYSHQLDSVIFNGVKGLNKTITDHFSNYPTDCIIEKENEFVIDYWALRKGKPERMILVDMNKKYNIKI